MGAEGEDQQRVGEGGDELVEAGSEWKVLERRGERGDGAVEVETKREMRDGVG